ncbi:hypothetical protein TIFTF001_036179 [Ficus carica]|uniref:Uncharacterized protein n=1 Tax=Ficus carica TaxID=3494 RepID=A0AA88JAU7_FICCA|nr:hypothetical protein TIFTF001_036179 [Ficus carica]
MSEFIIPCTAMTATAHKGAALHCTTARPWCTDNSGHGHSGHRPQPRPW